MAKFFIISRPSVFSKIYCGYTRNLTLTHFYSLIFRISSRVHYAKLTMTKGIGWGGSQSMSKGLYKE